METFWIIVACAFAISLAMCIAGVVVSITRKKTEKVQPLLGVVMPNKEEDKNA
jgi:hypothetical protein